MPTSPPPGKNPLPRYRGFNLLEMFIYSPGLESIAPGDSADFRESDLSLIRELGFDFIRIPLDYRFWTHRTSATGPWSFRELPLQRLDRVLHLAQQYNLHTSLNFHHAPGYCVNIPSSEWTLFNYQSAPASLATFASQWHHFAARFKHIPSSALSFDLVNEPPHLDPLTALTTGFSRKSHEHVIRSAIHAIRLADPSRLILANGLNYGNETLPELADLAPLLAQSCRAYLPFGISHYEAPWVSYQFPRAPAWPNADHFGTTYTREHLEAHYQKWADLIARGVGVHCGEGGAYNKTPHRITLAWFADVLQILHRHQIGWALWNFRGDFGILDSKRSDVSYENFHGHQLDRRYLELLQAW